MCGLVGGWWKLPPNNVDARIKVALQALAKRGPNDRGVERFAVGGGVLALGHTRLSIIELSSAGHQPMMSRDGRFVLVFNGEIYNYRELRTELTALGHTFTSDSDTEVLLAAWVQWQRACIVKLDGMFAFGVYDNKKQTFSCVRDAFGIKPLFFQCTPDRFLFASEQPALLALRQEKPEANWQRSYDYLVHNDYDSNEFTFIKGVRHLLPGHCLEVNLATGKMQSPDLWWAPTISSGAPLSFDQAAEATREQFLHNIRLQLRSDVPLGAALSGGIDSSAVVCAMRYVEPDLPINTFSYIASDSRVSEERWVDRVNAFVNAKAHKLSATGADLARDLDTMIRTQGEPFGSTSIYAQYRVFQTASENAITVMLDGQGADELLAGYNGYPGRCLLSLIEQGRFLKAHQFARHWSQWPDRSYKLAVMHLGRILLPDRLYSAARKGLGRDFAPGWLKTGLLSEANIRLAEFRRPLHKGAKGRRLIEQLANELQRGSLPPLLRHGDRNSMHFSIESRVPFLTTSMAHLLLAMPENYLVSNQGETKSVFRAAMRGIVPDDVLDRRDKVGFVTPEKEWLLGMAPMVREWLEASRSIPFFNREALLQHFDSVVAGRIPFTWQVWRWVNFVRWYGHAGLGS